MVLLSGTPVLSRPIEIYTQAAALRPHIFGTQRDFEVRYCNGHHSRFGWDNKGAANTENTYYGVSVTGVRGDPAFQGFDVQWTSVGLDLEGEDFDIHRQVANNISTRSSSPVPVNELP